MGDLSRRGFIGGAAAAAVAGGALLGAVPARAEDSTPEGPFGGAPAPAAVDGQAAPSLLPGTALRWLDPTDFRALDGSAVAFSTALASVYPLQTQSIFGVFDLPPRAWLRQVDCYGERITSGTQSWQLGTWSDLATNAGFVTSTGTETSPTGTGLLQATFTGLLNSPSARQKMVVALLGASSNSRAVSVAYQYQPRLSGFVPVGPYRAYDTRWPTVGSRISGGSDRTIDIKDARNLSGGLVTADVLPSNTVAVTFTLTVVGTSGSGFLALAPAGTPTFSASTINWYGDGQTMATGGTVALATDLATPLVKVFAGGPGSTDFVLDITGYYR